MCARLLTRAAAQKTVNIFRAASTLFFVFHVSLSTHAPRMTPIWGEAMDAAT